MPFFSQLKIFPLKNSQNRLDPRGSYLRSNDLQRRQTDHESGRKEHATAIKNSSEPWRI